MRKNIPASACCLFTLITLMLGTYACKKQGASVTPNGCISRTPAPANFKSSLSAAYIDSIKTLFLTNGLDYTKHSFTEYYPAVTGDSLTEHGTLVNSFPIVNGLPVFNSGESFVFTGTKLDSAYVSAAKPASADSSGNKTLAELQQAFLNHVQESKVFSSLSNGTSLSAQQVKDSCEVATLGYLDASHIPGSSVPANQQLVKVWAITLSSGGFSLVYQVDGTTQAWGQVFLAP